jgi:UDP-N-acetylglucosamine 2-epimerase (non-hydrolysing)
VKIATVLGTRPEIIRLSRVIEKLDDASEHILVHTGQNRDPKLSDIFFSELALRKPDHYLGVGDATSFGEQAGRILAGCELLFAKERPDRVLILGDTNSGLAAIVAKRLGIAVFHMEAGNRCYDDRVPEEVNRRIIDHSSDVLMPYTERSRANLLREGMRSERIVVTGNPILEVIEHCKPQIDRSTVLQTLGLAKQQYALVTLHRAENVDLPHRLAGFITAFDRLADRLAMPVIVSTHPRTRSRIEASGITGGQRLRLLEPFGFFDFIALERAAHIVLSDSGTVQEETAIFGVPNVTLRDVTERPETIECGSNVLSGGDPASIARCVDLALSRPPAWIAPPGYLVKNVSDTVVRVVCGYHPQFG